MTNQKIEFKGTNNNIFDFLVLLMVAGVLPTMFGLSAFHVSLIYILEVIFLFFYLKSRYTIEIRNGELLKKNYFSKKKVVFSMSKNNIIKAYFGFPAIKGLPVAKITFKEPNEEIKIVTLNSNFLKHLYFFLVNNDIKCEVYPPESKRKLE